MLFFTVFGVITFQNEDMFALNSGDVHLTLGSTRGGAAEQRRALSAAAGWLECAHGTDKVPGDPELSRPMVGAAPTPSIGMCALHVCRCAVA